MTANDNPGDEPRRGRFGPLWLLLPALVVAIVADYQLAAAAPDFDTLGLGEQTQSIYGSYGGDKIFCGSPQEAPECLGPAARRHLARRIVWVGNSQLHAINQSKPGQITAPVMLAQTLRPKGVEMQAMSFPNGSLSEFTIAYLLERKAAHIDVLVVPLFLDDTREGEIRDVLRPVALDPAIKPVLAASPGGREILAALPAAAEAATAPQSLQARSENAITAWLERCCGFQTMRENARGQFAIQTFYARNSLFNVNAQSARPIIPNTYNFNMAALDTLLATAAADHTRVIVYIAPLRQDVTPPYVPADYQRFKAETRALAARHGAVWADLDNIVAGSLWGMKNAPKLGGGMEYDFMHFQEPGHVAVAQHVLPLVEAALK